MLATLARLGADRVALERFLDATGLDVRALRSGLNDQSLHAGVMHYLAGEEDLLIAVAADLGLRPEVLSVALERAVGPDGGRKSR